MLRIVGGIFLLFLAMRFLSSFMAIKVTTKVTTNPKEDNTLPILDESILAPAAATKDIPDSELPPPHPDMSPGTTSKGTMPTKPVEFGGESTPLDAANADIVEQQNSLQPVNRGIRYRCPDNFPIKVGAGEVCRRNAPPGHFIEGKKIYSCPTPYTARTAHTLTSGKACSRPAPKGSFLTGDTYFQCEQPFGKRNPSAAITSDRACQRESELPGTFRASGGDSLYQCVGKHNSRAFKTPVMGPTACHLTCPPEKTFRDGNTLYRCPPPQSKRNFQAPVQSPKACMWPNLTSPLNRDGGRFAAPNGGIYVCPRGMEYNSEASPDGSKGCRGGRFGPFARATRVGNQFAPSTRVDSWFAPAKKVSDWFAPAKKVGNKFADAKLLGSDRQKGIVSEEGFQGMEFLPLN